MRRTYFPRVFFLAVITVTLVCSACFGATKPGHVYVLWQGLEPDKCAVSWLVKRFVDKDAVFRIVPKGTEISGFIPLDTPDSKIQRTQNQPAFEVALVEYRLDNPALRRISRILWDIEINKWGKKVTEESVGLTLIITGLVKKECDEQKALQQSFIVYDALYCGLGEGK